MKLTSRDTDSHMHYDIYYNIQNVSDTTIIFKGNVEKQCQNFWTMDTGMLVGTLHTVLQNISSIAAE